MKRIMNNLEIILMSALIIIAVMNLITVSLVSSSIGQKANEAKEIARPASLEVTKIIYPSCDGCYNIDDILSQIKQTNSKITKETSIGMNDAADIIAKYSIKKLPAAIVTGEISKNSDVLSALMQYGSKSGDAVLIDKFDPPYYDISENRIVGKIDATILKDSSCSQCANMSSLINMLKRTVTFSSEKSIDSFSAEGKELADRLGIQKVPVLILSKDIVKYLSLEALWTQLNASSKDDNLVIPPLSPPYVDLASNKTVGLVSLIYISDPSCSGCYNVSLHKTILLQSFGVVLVNETTYDVLSGKDLLSRYNITKVPTMLISPDAFYYMPLKEVWKDVGTVESDGWLVFRSTELMGSYKDLATGSVVEAKKN